VKLGKCGVPLPRTKISMNLALVGVEKTETRVDVTLPKSKDQRSNLRVEKSESVPASCQASGN